MRQNTDKIKHYLSGNSSINVRGCDIITKVKCTCVLINCQVAAGRFRKLFSFHEKLCFHCFKHKKTIIFHHFYCKVSKPACTIFFLYSWAHRRNKKMAAALLTAASKTFGRNWWVGNIIHDDVETSARKSQARFQIYSSLILG